MGLKPFLSYFGSKWRVSPHYPQPQHQTIIEPFAGAAGYSLRYPERNVKLYDADPTIVCVWDFLIHASPEEIRALPVKVEHVDELHVCQEAKWLIGFWLNKGTTRPSKTPGKWMRTYQSTQTGTYWSEAIRQRLASQVAHIRHWTIKQASYDSIPNMAATWFVDPPYAEAGKHYKFHDLDYPRLGNWCRSRNGQVIVCENTGADWLPFRAFRTIKGLEGKRGGKKSVEVIWTNDELPTSTGREPRCYTPMEAPGIDINSETIPIAAEHLSTL
jgi:site-specific DNA-adenine methylase